jgi:hypothetical protein
MKDRRKDRYLFARYIQRPRDKTKTHIKGYMLDEKNTQFDEVISFATRVKTKDLTMSRVILNLDKQLVVKNSINEEATFEQLYGYFAQNYQKQILDYIQQTAHLRPATADDFTKLAREKLGDEELVQGMIALRDKHVKDLEANPPKDREEARKANESLMEDARKMLGEEKFTALFGAEEV